MTREMIANAIHWSTIVWVFGFANVFAMVPQLKTTIQTRNVENMNVKMFWMYCILQMAFGLDGFFKRNAVLMVCMFLSAVISATLIILFYRYRQPARR